MPQSGSIGSFRGQRSRGSSSSSALRVARPGSSFREQQQQQQDGGVASDGAAAAAAAGSSVLGAIALITGSSVGAGVLALPSVSAPAGFIPSSTCLVACWGLLTLEALVMAEVNVAVGTNKGSSEYKPTTLTQAAQATLGGAGSALLTSGYLLTSYTMLVAYMCKGNDVATPVLAPLLDAFAGLPPQACGAMLAVFFGGFLHVSDADEIERGNNILTGSLLAAFLYIVFGGAAHADFSWLGATQNWDAMGPALPILFLALVYHDLVPMICSLLGGDLPRIRQALVIGGACPLAMFLTWNAVALAMVPADPSLASVDPMLLLGQMGLPMMDGAVSSFGILAIATSFIGTFLGLTSYLEIQLPALMGQEQQQRSPTASGDDEVVPPPASSSKLPAFLLALLPPLAVYWTNSDGFLPAAQFAGAYGMTTLYALMPPLMAWQLLGASEEEPRGPGKPMAAYEGSGGRAMLVSMTAAAVGLESLKAALDAGISFDQVFTHVEAMGSSFNAAIPELAAAADQLW